LTAAMLELELAKMQLIRQWQRKRNNWLNSLANQKRK
jgi:hypothetical protein